MSTRAPWIDERVRAAGTSPWRKVHLDFNNGANVSGIGADFDADDFVATLERARVDAIVVFAKCVHGYCYYQSDLGPIHPGLVEPDLLGEQVRACRRAGIKVYAYYSINWDELLAEGHPEWQVVKRDRSTYQPPFGERPFWTALCISHPELMEIVERHTTEVLEACEVDGMWYDMASPIGGECYCWRCLRLLRSAGLDPFDRLVQRRHKNDLFTELQRRLGEHVRNLRPGTGIDFNTQAALGLRDRLDLVENIDIEALPTGGWGYDYFPIHARYARTFGVTVFGMSGKFAKSWGDYGGLKHPTQLRTELAGIIAQGVRCDIGDEPPPGMRLDGAVYETIGEAYAEVERLQPYLTGAVPVTEAAIVVDGPPLMHFDAANGFFPSELGDSVSGLAQLLMAQHVQFDVVDAPTEFERYRLVLLPDALEVDQALADRLTAYLDHGGAVLASHRALRLNGDGELWPVALQGALRGPSPYEAPYVRIAGDLLGSATRYRDYDFVLYDGADRWLIPNGADGVVHARLTEPQFELTETSFQHPPPGDLTDYAAVVELGRLGAASFPLGTSFLRHGYWVYRELFARLLRSLLPEPLVVTDAPMSAEVTLTHQPADDGHGSRWLVHVVNYSPLRSPPSRIEYVEDPTPLRDVQIALAVDEPIARAYEVSTGAELALQREGDRWQVTLPKTTCGSIVAFETAS